MDPIIVAIDLETTGLDPRLDQIIEIGAARFRGTEVLEEFQTFVYPGRTIPPFITRLTGIRDSDVERAPWISGVLPSLRHFIGDSPILGHNIRFDLGMLQHAGFQVNNPIIDTYALASVLMPDNPRYSLSSLVSQFDVEVGKAHRALDDALRTIEVYIALSEKTRDLPLKTLEEIVRVGNLVDWAGRYFFQEILKSRSKRAFIDNQAGAVSVEDELPLLATEKPDAKASFSHVYPPSPIDADEIRGIFEPGGALATAFTSYEHRSQQVDMALEATRAFNEGKHVFIEAPTGVGKSLAYLIPAVRFALANDDRVVISTNTINLQEQLLDKDIPLLRQSLGWDFRAALLKGRSNYLCPRRLKSLQRRGPTSEEEMLMLAKLLVWLHKSTDGDRGSLSLRGPDEMSIWYRLSAEDESCSLSHCEFEQRGDCPYFKARRRAENSHVIIVNHSLLLSDVMADGRVLPEYHYLVVDEAQHLEDAVTNSLSFHTDRDLIKRQLKELGDAQSGLFGEMLSETLGVIPQGFHETLEDYVGVVTKAISEMRQHVEWFFEATRAFIEATNHVRHNEYAQQVRITTATRTQPGWSEVEMHWDNLSKFTSGIAEAMTKLVTGFSELQKYDIENFYDISASLGGAARRLSAMHARLEEFVIEPDSNTVYWVDFQPGNQRFSLNAAPIEVGQLVKKHIWYEKDTVIMTSATMRTDDSFTYIRNRLGGDDAEESVIATPFDYRKSTLLYVVSDIPEPTKSQEYQAAVENCLRDLCIAAEGRTMVLFTSYAQLQETTNAIGDDLRAAGIEIYDQSEGISRSQMLDGFKTSDKAVLMGTRSFWEGVDIPGPSLSILVIIRLPFSVPTDPVFAARSETFDNSFTEYSVPDAILRFRQGFGRLIRRKQDHGVVVIFDPRIYTKQYGRMFVNSLPDCTIRRGTASQLPHYALEWLDNRE